MIQLLPLRWKIWLQSAKYVKKWEDKLIIWQYVLSSNMSSQKFSERRVFLQSAKSICCKLLHSNRKCDHRNQSQFRGNFHIIFFSAIFESWMSISNPQLKVRKVVCRKRFPNFGFCSEKDHNNGHWKRPFRPANWQKSS
jgi:hypothetical protein